MYLSLCLSISLFYLFLCLYVSPSSLFLSFIFRFDCFNFYPIVSKHSNIQTMYKAKKSFICIAWFLPNNARKQEMLSPLIYYIVCDVYVCHGVWKFSRTYEAWLSVLEICNIDIFSMTEHLGNISLVIITKCLTIEGGLCYLKTKIYCHL